MDKPETLVNTLTHSIVRGTGRGLTKKPCDIAIAGFSNLAEA